LQCNGQEKSDVLYRVMFLKTVLVLISFSFSIFAAAATSTRGSGCEKKLSSNVIVEMARLRILISRTGNSGGLQGVRESLWGRKFEEAKELFGFSDIELQNLIRNQVSRLLDDESRSAPRPTIEPRKIDDDKQMLCENIKGKKLRVGFQCITNRGAIFTKVKRPGFGYAWMDMSGMIWSKSQGMVFNNKGRIRNRLVVDSPATRLCAEIGGKLPTKEDYQRFQEYFGMKEEFEMTAEGYNEMLALFPDMELNYFWSSSLPKSCNDYTYGFDGTTGGHSYYLRWNNSDLRNGGGAVRCVAK
jgi:hypothetical protein